MGIEVMAVLMKLLAIARREWDTTGHHHRTPDTTASKQASKHSNPSVILYKMDPDSNQSSFADIQPIFSNDTPNER